MPNVIHPDETQIVGRWLMKDGQLTADQQALRIQQLINSYLIKVSRSVDGWTVLYRDPNDNRYWELTYPDSATHGGGAPSLSVISVELAKARYDFHE